MSAVQGKVLARLVVGTVIRMKTVLETWSVEKIIARTSTGLLDHPMTVVLNMIIENPILTIMSTEPNLT